MSKKQKKDHRKSSLSRRQGVREIKQSFLIVCEGEKTEPDYFKAFRMTTATVKAVGQAMNTMTLVNKASAYAKQTVRRNVNTTSAGWYSIRTTFLPTTSTKPSSWLRRTESMWPIAIKLLSIGSCCITTSTQVPFTGTSTRIC